MTVPATGWRGGVLARGLLIGATTGLFFGALALLDSGLLVAGAIVFVVMGVAMGVSTSRRMSTYWPGAADFSGAERVTIVRAARRGYRVDDKRLAAGVVDYSAGLRAAAERLHPYRWVVWLVIVVALGSAAWDAVAGSVRETAASCVYLGLLAIELFWWPSRRRELLLNAALASALAQQALDEPGDEERTAAAPEP
ncbi:hypothetical protein [Mycolicibacterium litorale]|uniref:hypothetical protein n=1 Tax=Mycolicibacterium litorale TaxID=758802 RepID=UPI0010E02CA8|nr:hypothetical protein [Mycolicibacterium litorale]TDY08312.1 hypothetical protein BCL50_0375 [Mycolicibacterium litorale]